MDRASLFRTLCAAFLSRRIFERIGRFRLGVCPERLRPDISRR